MASTPSHRTPQYSTRNNTADNIERYLQEDSHKIWGFVIYRCTYSSDPDWTRFIALVQDRVRSALKTYNGLDMLESLSTTVISDQSLFDDGITSISAVREHFKQWATTAPQREQNTGPGLSQRYRYCVYVDKEALQSVLENTPEPGQSFMGGAGFVKVVWKDWESPEPNDRGNREAQAPPEDLTQQDTGWMRVNWRSVMVDMYYYLRGQNDWYAEYRSPPEIAQA